MDEPAERKPQPPMSGVEAMRAAAMSAPGSAHEVGHASQEGFPYMASAQEVGHASQEFPYMASAQEVGHASQEGFNGERDEEMEMAISASLEESEAVVRRQAETEARPEELCEEEAALSVRCAGL